MSASKPLSHAVSQRPWGHHPGETCRVTVPRPDSDEPPRDLWLRLHRFRGDGPLPDNTLTSAIIPELSRLLAAFKMRRLVFVLALAFLPVLHASTYYVSSSAGNDSLTSAQAQNKSTPWAHLPGMQAHPAYTPVAGDTFVLMGCDSWLNSSFPINWTWSGTSGNPITVTVDKSWYNTTACPSGWNRPIFDGQKRTIGGGGMNNVFLKQAGTAWVVWDNVEWKGLHCGAGAPDSGPNCGAGGTSYIWGNTTNWTYSNNYIHGWDIAYDNNCILVGTDAPNLWTNGVMDGSDRTSQITSGSSSGTCEGFYSSFPNITNSVMHDLANGATGTVYPNGSTVEWGGNLVYNIVDSNTGNHPNAFEVTGGGGTVYIHDNVIHDMGPGAENIMFGNVGQNTYIWNNVIYSNTSSGNSPTVPQIGGSDAGNFWFWNNSILGVNGSACLINNGGTFHTSVVQNNFCVSTAASGFASFAGGTSDHNATLNPTQLSTYGYDGTGAGYVYSPTSATCNSQTNCPVGAGANLAANCVGNLSSLCNQTSYGVVYNPTAQTVTLPVAPLTRAVAWDIGAYQYSAGTVTALNACDLDQNGVVNSSDVSIAVNMALGRTSCTANITGVGVCTVVTVQRVVNASLGGACLTQ